MKPQAIEGLFMILFCQRYVNSQQITDPVGKYLQMCTDQHFESGTEYCAGLRMHTAKKHLLFWQEVVQDQVKSSPNFLELCHEIVSLPKCATFDAHLHQLFYNIILVSVFLVGCLHSQQLSRGDLNLYTKRGGGSSTHCSPQKHKMSVTHTQLCGSSSKCSED